MAGRAWPLRFSPGNAGHDDIAHLADHTLRSIAELPALLRSI